MREILRSIYGGEISVQHYSPLQGYYYFVWTTMLIKGRLAFLISMQLWKKQLPI